MLGTFQFLPYFVYHECVKYTCAQNDGQKQTFIQFNEPLMSLLIDLGSQPVRPPRRVCVLKHFFCFALFQAETDPHQGKGCHLNGDLILQTLKLQY